MPPFTRRKFFRNTFTATAAAGVLIAAPRLLEAGPGRAAAATPKPAQGREPPGAARPLPSEPVVAYVRDYASGEIAILVGSREIVRRDPDLVARLLQTGA